MRDQLSPQLIRMRLADSARSRVQCDWLHMSAFTLVEPLNRPLWFRFSHRHPHAPSLRFNSLPHQWPGDGRGRRTQLIRTSAASASQLGPSLWLPP